MAPAVVLGLPRTRSSRPLQVAWIGHALLGLRPLLASVPLWLWLIPIVA